MAHNSHPKFEPSLDKEYVYKNELVKTAAYPKARNYEAFVPYVVVG